MRALVIGFFLAFGMPLIAQDLAQQMVMQQQNEIANQQAQQFAQQSAQAMQQAQQSDALSQASYGWTSRPGFSLKGGTYKKSFSVRMYDETPGATIYYTTDGSTPTKHSAVYARPVPVTATTRLRAVAVARGRQDSLEKSAEYRISVQATP